MGKSRRPVPASNRALEPLVPKVEPDDLSGHAHRQFIGILGLVLPILLWLIAAWRHGTEPPRLNVLSSVSAYYYTGAVAAFVGILISLAVYLFIYQGYDNEYRRRDRIAATIAGAAAVLVAFFPTGAPDGFPRPSWWTGRTGTIHNVSAAVLFGAFIFFALFLFPKSKVKKGNPLPLDKRVRNGFYISCGVAMAVCMAWAGIAGLANEPIFWPEALALEFFAVSWLVKGRVEQTAVAVGRRTLHYGRHPGQLVAKARSAIRG